jgi:hypothetical protein
MRSAFASRGTLHRLTAALGIGLILALNLLAVLPTAHAWLHDRAAGAAHAACAHHRGGPDTPMPAEDDCAVVKFARGDGGFPLAFITVHAKARALVVVLGAREIVAAFTRDVRLPPGCGPPAV